MKSKRDKPLPSIAVEDPNNMAAVKRAQNTTAETERFEETKATIKELQAKVTKWKSVSYRRQMNHDYNYIEIQYYDWGTLRYSAAMERDIETCHQGTESYGGDMVESHRAMEEH
ncbi:MAG: hypothetical protein MMC33_005988 [Icmadophila ericetorum]|nr:hypothetical protein [Icmadophila ericetorum]